MSLSLQLPRVSYDRTIRGYAGFILEHGSRKMEKRHLLGCFYPNGPCYCDERERDAARDEAMSFLSKSQREELEELNEAKD